MAKKVVAEIKLQIPAGQANPSPPVGPALGQRGVNIMEFCKAFNAQTQAQAGLVIPVVITVYADRSFTFVTKTPPAEELAKKIQDEQWLEFDTAIATPDMMGAVGRLGKILGPRGLMPNPKVGTVTPDVTAAVKAAKGGAVEFKVEKAGIVHAGVGKASFASERLVENIKAFADAVQKAKPAGAKGTFVQRIAVTSTMGPGVKVEPST